ncbi:hypothetical protein EBI01_01590 [Marinomonas rhizomae]|uniref:Uncharacterized protein n=1 Tax=Marinomonas rhizomae TaxID=491948 RepID=A0A366JFT4_9GAMM|nr:hypothetical protein [Marinomonas rhizomae]RBP85320.1 hypothetical protein DFP80_102318 [Marinomonas rhizomae]RNF76416.1 hypothetical protein EBI01_01590 [Marinomonas rhizomae]
MAEVTISLQRRLRIKIFILASAIFFAVILMTLYFIEALNQTAAEKNLSLKHRVVEQTFNGYLARAADEMKFIGQDLALSNYGVGRELDLLFSHHEVLLSGGVDFFYIEWADGKYSMDPRARLFTKVDLQSVLGKGMINRWASIVTNDDSILLMFKKQLFSSDQENIGFLYGFISLNDNLTLANELLESAQVSAVRIYDNAHNRILLEEHKTGVDLSGATLHSRLPLISPIKADLQLDIVQKHSFSSAILANALPLIAGVGAVLCCACFLLFRQIRKLIFQPLESIAYRNEEGLLPYRELQPIQLQSQQYKAFIEAKEHRFKLLAESIHCAVVFCTEVAEVELINSEAKDLFPDADKARTLFDFMPISCHQSIQEALKGEVGVSFELTINSLGRIYQWQAYSFKNESDYRGLLLVGRNVTQETRLTWQLEQLQPLSSALQKKVDTDDILDELRYLSSLPGYIDSTHFRGWLALLISVLDDISSRGGKVTHLPIGEVFCQESARVMAAMGVEVNRTLLDCSVEDGARVTAIDANFRGLIRVLFMMVMSNDMAERRLTVRFDGTKLDMIATHDMAFRPLFDWMIKMLLTHLGGQQKTLQNNAMQINLIMEELGFEVSFEPLARNKVVAWVANDYPNPDVIKAALVRLGVQVEGYVSTDSFFTQSSAVAKFDAVLIGCDKDIAAQADMTQALKLKYNRDDLPIVWLNSSLPIEVDPHVFTLQGCSFDYNLHQILLKACVLDGITPAYSNEQTSSWVMVGGSRITKAIWFAELEKYDVTTQWLADLSNYHVVLSYHPDAVVVLLSPQPHTLLLSIQKAFPKSRLFSVQRWPEMPDNVALFDMTLPYSGDQIRHFTQKVIQQRTDSRSNE